MKSVERKSKPQRILLVDDDASRRNTRAVILLTHGYDVESVATISDALDACETDEPDLLLIGTTQRASSRSLLEQIGKSYPRQRVGFLLDEGEKLCAVQFDGELLLAEEAAGDWIARVATLLDRGNRRRSPLLAVGAA